MSSSSFPHSHKQKQRILLKKKAKDSTVSMRIRTGQLMRGKQSNTIQDLEEESTAVLVGITDE